MIAWISARSSASVKRRSMVVKQSMSVDMLVGVRLVTSALAEGGSTTTCGRDFSWWGLWRTALLRVSHLIQRSKGCDITQS